MPTLRYTGVDPVSIPALGVDLEPGDLVEAPEAVADELAARSDFKRAGNKPAETVDEVLERVGDDPVEAERALVAEQAGPARKTLVSRLTEIIESANADDDPEEG